MGFKKRPVYQMVFGNDSFAKERAEVISHLWLVLEGQQSADRSARLLDKQVTRKIMSSTSRHSGFACSFVWLYGRDRDEARELYTHAVNARLDDARAKLKDGD